MKDKALSPCARRRALRRSSAQKICAEMHTLDASQVKQAEVDNEWCHKEAESCLSEDTRSSESVMQNVRM